MGLDPWHRPNIYAPAFNRNLLMQICDLFQWKKKRIKTEDLNEKDSP